MRKLLLGALLAFVGCSSNINVLNSDARFVRIATQEPAPNCDYLGEVYGTQENAGLSEAQLNEGVINDAKNKAYKLGGDTIYFLDNKSIRGTQLIIGDKIKSGDVNVTALVYRCKS